mmetsp:Transcript_17875/g.21421  ORF Transcript_17875/g.21421 Transcript_17875/m.21421 type:complete len:117 (-) Transcript_17875:232-582(-)|eukprot:CAMPEP_0195255284 /NCGR_PEP_ID=MMETSP0706-20130129/5555_1 /TAXON_ID=33640 /ORGANISM="Asterionellopsis glacialis, Strain CCMP134" /LENGTH=116 /DNA_ID=CAMNT_0040308119 /DNA_START=48 /DNA_END=398 /DNA_ORIENTATION=+
MKIAPILISLFLLFQLAESKFGEERRVPDSSTSTNNQKEERTKQRIMTSNEPGKTEWPEVVGMAAEDAKTLIEGECGCTVQVIPMDAMVTMDYRTDRVRIRVNEATGKVAFSPTIG